MNSVGIAQACAELGHRPVFLRDPGFEGLFQGYGFEERTVHLSAPMPAAEASRYWADFVSGHLCGFDKSPYDQLDDYVRHCWEAIVDTAVFAERELRGVLAALHADLIAIDNVIMFPAIKRSGARWVRIVSCSENEIPAPDIPPHLSGCSPADRSCCRRFAERFTGTTAAVHRRFNEFLIASGEPPYPAGQFFEPSPWLNLLLYPQAVRFRRRNPLDPEKFQYLDGCVRKEQDHTLPSFGNHASAPLVYLSFGSLGCADIQLMKRFIEFFATQDLRALINVGDYADTYDVVPGNVHLANWYPQPSVIAQVDAVIHHGGNNSFTECLYFGKPSLIMPYVWDGHDNATRVAETGHGLKMH